MTAMWRKVQKIRMVVLLVTAAMVIAAARFYFRQEKVLAHAHARHLSNGSGSGNSKKLSSTQRASCAKIAGCSQSMHGYASDKQGLAALSSSACCRPFASLRLINDSGDVEQTYLFPTEELLYSTPRQLACDATTELFIAVKSAFTNSRRRDALRSTWLSNACGRLPNATSRFCRWAWRHTKVAFFVSSPLYASKQDLFTLLSELNQHGDMVLISLVEHYHNLTLKTASSLHWSVSHCPQARYVIFTDDDMLLNVTNIWRLLLSMETLGNARTLPDATYLNELVSKPARQHKATLFHGWLRRGEEVLRDGVWTILPSAYAPSHYPDLLVGWFVLMSACVAERLVRASLCTRLLWLDDVFLYGILPEALGLKRRQLPGLVPWFERPLVFPGDAAMCEASVGIMFEDSEDPKSIWAAC